MFSKRLENNVVIKNKTYVLSDENFDTFDNNSKEIIIYSNSYINKHFFIANNDNILIGHRTDYFTIIEPGYNYIKLIIDNHYNNYERDIYQILKYNEKTYTLILFLNLIL